jgi:hypothetical protein
MVLAGVVLTIVAADSSAQTPGLKTLMREKLGNAQQLLEAVIAADHQAIGRYADRLSWISETEIASWQTVAQPEYVRQATIFLTAVKGLREASTARNTAAATTEFTSLVSSCVQCHTYVRGSRVAALLPRR